MPQHWRQQGVFWDKTGSYQCFAAACCHLHWRGKRLQHLRFLQWKWPAWYTEPLRMWECVGPRRLLKLHPKIPKSFKTFGKMTLKTVRSRNKKILCLEAGTSLRNDDKRTMTKITTHKWDITNLLNIHIYNTRCCKHWRHFVTVTTNTSCQQDAVS